MTITKRIFSKKFINIWQLVQHTGKIRFDDPFMRTNIQSMRLSFRLTYQKKISK